MQDEHFIDLNPADPAWGHAYALGAGGVRLHYVRQGQGQPVVLLHGWPGFWYDWRRVIPIVAREASVIAPDFRGFGESEKPKLPPDEAFTVDDLAADVVALMDGLGFDEFVVAGYDIGSSVAQVLARTVPERVRALVLFNPSYPGIGLRRQEPAVQREFWYQHFHRLPWADQLAGYNRDTVRLYLSHFYDHWTGRKDAVRPAEFEAIVDVYARPGAMRASIVWYSIREATRAREAAASPATLRIDQPAFVLWGDVDPVFPSAWAAGLEEYFSRLSLRFLAGTGHFVPLEAPDEAVAALRSALAAARGEPDPLWSV